MKKKIEIINEEEILFLDADDIIQSTDINLSESDLDAIKESEAKVGRATSAVANSVKLQRVALEELDAAEAERQETVRKLATKYNIPSSVDWQINLTSGKIVMMPERD